MRISDWSSDVCSSDLQGDKITLLDRQFDAMQHLDALLAALVHLGQAMDFDQRAHGFLSITLLPSRNAGGGDNATTSPSFTPLITSVSASATVPVLISRRRQDRKSVV